MTLKYAQVATVALLVALSVGGCAGTQIAVDPQWTPVVVIVAPTADPGEVSPTPVAPDGPTTTYVVVAGDTLSGLAERYNLTVEELAALNGLDSQAQLRIGQRLTVPRVAR